MRLSPQTLFENWTAESSVWSPWAKPTVFSTMSPSLQKRGREVAPPQIEVGALDPPDGRTAVVVDLPGGEAVDFGAALAARGYQPVPLFNGVPAPRNVPAVVNNTTLAKHLALYADDMAEITLPDQSPPAFLISADRMTPRRRRKTRPGDFDNRWMVFRQDFPSGHFLLDQHIDRAVVVQRHKPPVASDLAHVLLGWQKAGVEIKHVLYPGAESPKTITIHRPIGFGGLYRRILVTLGLRRNAAGGFGATVPLPAESSDRGGGFYG